MKKTKKVFLVILITFLVLGQVFAQDATEKTEEKTVEERFLSTSVEIAIIGELAKSDTRDQKLIALGSIEKMVKDGSGSANDPAVQKVLSDLSTEGINIIVREGSRKINNFPEVRRRAAEILGELGGEKAQETLIGITVNENEPMVLSQAIYSLGTIGLNNNNETILAISKIMDIDSKKTLPDNNLAIASILAIEKIAKENNGFPKEPEPTFIYQTILSIQNGNYNQNVKKWATLLLEKLKVY